MSDLHIKKIYGSIACPLWFLVVLFVCITLYFLRFTPTIHKPSFEMSTFLIISFLFCLIGIVAPGRSNTLSNTRCVKSVGITNLGFGLLWFLYGISILAYMYEHYVFYMRFGDIPILLIDFEVKRMLFPVSGYIHLVAMMGYIFLLVLFFEKVFCKRRSKKYNYILFLCIVMSLMFSFIVGNRGVIFLFLFTLFIVYSFKKKVSISKLAILGVICAYLLGVLKFARDYVYYGEDIYSSIERNWDFGTSMLSAPLYYTYMTFVMNFEMLNKYLTANFEHTFGYFTIFSPLASVFPVDLVELVHFQKTALDIDFYGTLTATGFGVPYIDFSIFSVFVSFIWCYFLSVVYKLVIYRGDIRYIPLYSYLLYNIFLTVYTYSFNKFYVLLNILFLLLIPTIFKVRPPLADNG